MRTAQTFEVSGDTIILTKDIEAGFEVEAFTPGQLAERLELAVTIIDSLDSSTNGQNEWTDTQVFEARYAVQIAQAVLRSLTVQPAAGG